MILWLIQVAIAGVVVVVGAEEVGGLVEEEEGRPGIVVD